MHRILFHEVKVLIYADDVLAVSESLSQSVSEGMGDDLERRTHPKL